MSGCGDVCDGSCLYSQYMGGRGSLGYIVDLSETLSHKTGSWVLTQWRVTIGTLQLHLHLKTLLWNAALTRHGCCHLDIVATVITHIKDPHSIGIPSQRGGRAPKATRQWMGLPRRLPRGSACILPSPEDTISIGSCWGKVSLLWHSVALLLLEIPHARSQKFHIDPLAHQGSLRWGHFFGLSLVYYLGHLFMFLQGKLTRIIYSL